MFPQDISRLGVNSIAATSFLVTVGIFVCWSFRATSDSEFTDNEAMLGVKNANAREGVESRKRKKKQTGIRSGEDMAAVGEKVVQDN